MRILLNPDPNQGGGAPAHPAFAQPPAGQPQGQAHPVQQPPASIQTIPLVVDEYQRLRGIETQYAAFQAKHAADLAAKEAERIQALHDKGKTQEAMEELRKSLTKQYEDERETRRKVEGQYHGEKKSAAMSSALMGVPFVSEVAAAQVKAILDSQFETRVDPYGQIAVVDKTTGQPAADIIRQKLASPEFAHFLKPQTQGGAGGGGHLPAQQHQNDNMFAPMDLSRPFGVYPRRN